MPLAFQLTPRGFASYAFRCAKVRIGHKFRNPMQNTDAPDSINHALKNWVEIATSAELDVQRPVLPIEINGKRLVLFRDDEGELGLIGRNCPHRGADLCFGRREDNGLRCPFHGWHFDRTGQCVEQPAEPNGSLLHRQIKVPMVPVMEQAGRIYARPDKD